MLVQAFAPGHPNGPEIVDAARRASLVEDPRLQRVLAAGEERGAAYVVLERLHGRGLVDLLGKGPLPAETARRVVGEAAQALDHAASRGLHHLRLRPASLVIGTDGAVTVVGTAVDAAADGAQSPDSAAATRSDAVGLVALLYTALTGRWPGAQDAGLARAPRVAGRPVPPADLVAGVPNDLDTLCAVALGPHDDGPRTPGELAGQLSPWAAAAPLTDPGGLQLGAPQRPSPPGAAPVPALGVPAEEAAPRRTPAWGLRLNRAGRAGPDDAHQPLAPGEGRDAASAGSQPGGGGRPGWATVDELRRALRRSAAAGAVAGGGSLTPGAVPGAGLPLAAAAPPAGGPLSAGAAPAGSPVADAVAPPGPPTVEPAAAVARDPLAGAPERPATPDRTGEDTSGQPAGPGPVAQPVPDDRGAAPDGGPATVAVEQVAGRAPRPAPAAAEPPTLVTPAVPPAPAVPAPPPVPVAGTTRAVPAPIPGPDEPDGLQGLDLLAAQARTAEPAEPVAPFGPDVPLTRPPREQSRLVLVVLGVLVVVVGVFAGRQLFSFDPAPLIGPGGGATGPVATATEGTPSSGATPGASPSRGSTPATPPVAVAAAQALDPQGDNNENNELAARAIDGDPRTVWRSERYDTPEFGGIKSGVGLALDLGDVGSVAGVTLDAPGSDGAVEVRVGDSPDYEGSRVVARAEVTGSGRLVLTAAKPVRTQYLLVWFTRVPQQDSGERRVVVDEVDVR